MQFIKGGFSFQLKSKLGAWQPGFTLRRIEDACDYQTHLQYIHENPVRAGLCRRADEFPYSSAHYPSEVDPPPHHLLGKNGIGT